ncbi:hypothetical protein SAMN05444672_1747 [Bacillus sp. OK838]|nr:hypothetical protein SAMN05444672_1747 [Bacillus sp. OK838]
MANFNPEFIKRLAMGDNQAFEQIKDLSTLERMTIGHAVDELRRKENIVPVSSGMSIYEEKKSSYTDNEAVGNALAELIQRQKEAEELKEKIRQEHLEKEVKYRVERARAGLTYR